MNIFSFSFHTDESRILKPRKKKPNQTENGELFRSINMKYSMYKFILLYECILSYRKTCKLSNNGWNNFFWRLSFKLPSRILDMFIQNHIVGLVFLLSGVPIFFSQKIQIRGLAWVLCDPDFFFLIAEIEEIILTSANICASKAKPIFIQTPKD